MLVIADIAGSNLKIAVALMHKREEKRGGGGLSIRSYKGGGKRKIG